MSYAIQASPRVPLKRCQFISPREGSKRRKCSIRGSTTVKIDAVIECGVSTIKVGNIAGSEGATHSTESKTHPLGYFCTLPTEIVHMILELLPRESLGFLALTSTQISSTVKNYLYTRVGLQSILPHLPSSHINVDPAEYQSLGLLLKRVTILQSLRIRLKTVSVFLKRLECTTTAIAENIGSVKAYECFGQLFCTYCSGWEEYEKSRAYCLVQSIAKLDERTGKVLHSSPGYLPWHEMDVRMLYRMVFLKPACSDEELAFWLTKILKPWPIVFQARLLYLLTAPEDSSATNPGFVSWSLVCGCSSFQHLDVESFTELAQSLCVLRQHRPKDWSEDDAISIVDELTTTPNGWCLENVACLLVHCGSEITQGFLGTRAVNGRIEELCVLVHHLARASIAADCERKTSLPPHKYMNWFLEVLKYLLGLLPSAHDKKRLSSSILSIWQDHITDLFHADCSDLEDSDENTDVCFDFQATLDSFTHFSTALMDLVLEQKCASLPC